MWILKDAGEKGWFFYDAAACKGDQYRLDLISSGVRLAELKLVSST